MAIMVAAVVPLIALTTFGYGCIQLNHFHWCRRIVAFRSKNHGYSTSLSSERDVLLIVSPASGGGRAMKAYDKTIEELRAQSRNIEVYVTRSSDDLMTLAETKNLEPYRMIVMLGGDSSLFEFVQPALRRCKGKWRYAPILHLPGGTGNALSGEFHGDLDVKEIVRNAAKVRSGGVIMARNELSSTRYALHMCFDGLQVALIDWMDSTRAFYAAFGKVGLVALFIAFTMSVPFRRDIHPIVLNICKSDFEGSGINLGLGVNRFDSHMAAVSGGPYKSRNELMSAYFYFLEGKLGQEIKSKKQLRYNMIARVCNRFSVQGAGRYRLYFDGSSSLPLEGENISFEVIPNAIRYYTVK